MLSKDRKLNRLKGYDYSREGWYFITICTKDKGNILGEINNNLMILNEKGRVVEKQLLWLSRQYKYLNYDEWIIMPDHIHGIMVIENDDNVGNSRDHSVHDRFVQEQKIKSISQLIGAFKTTSSKIIHILGYFSFQWHKSFYDEIIRDEKSLERIRKYIIENPMKVGNGRDRSVPDHSVQNISE